MSQTEGDAAPQPEQPKAVDDGMTVIQRYQKALAIALEKLNVAQAAANNDDILFDERDDRSVSVFSQTQNGTVSKSVKLPHMYGTPGFLNEAFIGLAESLEEAPQ